MSVHTDSSDKLSLRAKLAYGSGSFGNNIIYGLMSIYLMVFYTDHFGLPVTVVGTLFFVSRIFDAILDPVVGILVDNTRTRWGQFRPYLLFAPVIVGICCTACFFSPDLSTSGKIVFAYVTYILWGLSFTFMDIPYWAMSASLTENTRERNSVVMIPRTLAAIAWTLIGMVTLPLVAFFGQGDDRNGYFLTALLISVLAVVLTLVTFFNCKEKVTVRNHQHQGMREILNTIRENGPMRIVIGGLLLLETVYAVKNVLPIYYLTYVYNAKSYIPLFMGSNLILTIIGSLTSPWLSNRYGKKNVAVWGNSIAALAGILFYLSGHSHLWPIFVFNSVIMISTAASNIALMSMLIDTIEYGEWKTGRRSEGLIFAANTSKAKIAGAIGGSLGAYGLAWIGYTPNAVQSSATVEGIHILYTLLPGILAFVAICPFFFYRLTEGRYNAILHALLKRRRAQAPQSV